MKIVGTIEARMGSSRLPGKTLMEIHDGKILLGVVVERFRLCKRVDSVVVATTTESKDDPIAMWCEQNGVLCYRGSEDDVLDRVAGACEFANADVIVQMGADSAYLDFELIDELIEVYKSGEFDYVCNDLELTYPLGVYGHIVRVSKLIELNKKENLSIEDREDVVRYIWEHPDEYKICHIKATPEKKFPNLRLTIDYPEDFELATTLFERFGRVSVTTNEIVALYKLHPEIFDKVSNLVQRSAPFLKSTHE